MRAKVHKYTHRKQHIRTGTYTNNDTNKYQTAMLSFGETHPRTPFLAHELCRERIAVYASEGRSDTALIKKNFPKVYIYIYGFMYVCMSFKDVCIHTHLTKWDTSVHMYVYMYVCMHVCVLAHELSGRRTVVYASQRCCRKDLNQKSPMPH
jgi:hypothetical protein